MGKGRKGRKKEVNGLVLVCPHLLFKEVIRLAGNS